MRHSLPERFSLPHVPACAPPFLSAARKRLVSAVALPLVLAVAVTAILPPVPARAGEHDAQAVPGLLPDRIDFGPGRYVVADGVPILHDNSYSFPHVCDWNGDGTKDLLVGVFFEGNVYLFLNQGTDDDPVFGEGTLLEADGEPISVGWG
jgi:hypothetical protein